MVKCPACGHENVDGTMFCEMCGEDMQSTGSAVAPDAAPDSAATSTGEIKCPACDNMNPADNVVCEICGTELRPASDDATVAVAATPATPASPSAPDLAGATASVPAVATPATSALNDIAAAATPDIPDTVTAPDVAVADDFDTALAPTAVDTSAPDDASGAAASSGPLLPGKVKLVVEQGMTIGKQFVLSDPEVQVGREDADEDIYPDIDLADQDEGYVHRKHATLKFENDQLLVTHLGGANKTRINNKPIPDNTPQPAKLGDKIAFGKVVLRLLPI